MNKNNPLNLERNKLWKKLFKIIFMAIYLILLNALIRTIIEWRFDESGVKKGITFTIVFTLLAVFRVFNKNACGAMRAVRGYMTYEELEKYLEHEEFKKIDGCIIKMEVSDYWINLEGIFIPRNFVSAIFIQREVRFNFLHVVLINGKHFSATICSSSRDPQDQVNIVLSILENSKNIIHWIHSAERKVIKKKFEEKLKSGKTVDMFIKQWDNNFDFKNFNEYEEKVK